MTTSPPPGVPVRRGETWVNWAGTVRAMPAFAFRPRSIEDVADCVRFAASNNLEVRCVGAGHSWSALAATSGALLDLTDLVGVRVVDRERRRVAVLAGTTVRQLNEVLWAEGFSLPNQGDIDVQTIAGALATGTHGSGVRLGNMSTAIRGMRMVDGRGHVFDISDGGPELWAASVSLGALGVAIEIEIEVMDRYYLHEITEYPTWDELTTSWEEDLTANHHWSWFWLPGDDSADLYDLAIPDGLRAADRSYVRKINVVDERTRPPVGRVDRNYLIYSNAFHGTWYEMEILVPVDSAAEAMRRIRSMVRHDHRAERYPVQPRWVAADQAFLSPAYQRDSVAISVSGTDDTDYIGYFAAIKNVLGDMHPRMHWGKVGLLTRAEVQRAYPALPEFLAVRKRLDPDARFLNDYLRALFLP